jgi:hypothetical protein
MDAEQTGEPTEHTHSTSPPLTPLNTVEDESLVEPTPLHSPPPVLVDSDSTVGQPSSDQVDRPTTPTTQASQEAETKVEDKKETELVGVPAKVARNLRFGCTSVQGPRSTMEDTHVTQVRPFLYLNSI